MSQTSRADGLKPSAIAVLGMLRQAGARGVTTGEFTEARHERFSARLEEIRRAGWKVDTVRITQAKFKYVLQAEPVGLRAGAPPSQESPPGAESDGRASPSAMDQPRRRRAGRNLPAGAADSLFDTSEFEVAA
jgi:hypothetical protein